MRIPLCTSQNFLTASFCCLEWASWDPPLFACIVVSIACVLAPAFSLSINSLKHDRADQIIAELGRQGGTAEGGGGYNFDKETQTDFI